MKDALAEVVREVPYNSVAQFLTATGRPLPKTFGGNCIYQIARLAEKLRDQASSLSYIRITGEDHHALLFTPQGGPQCFLDPTLLQQDPLDLRAALHDGTESVCRAYPTLGAAHSELRLSRTGPTAFSVVVKSIVDGRLRFVEKCNYDLENCTEVVPPHDDRMFLHKRPRLTLRLLQQNGMVAQINFSTKSHKSTIRRSDGLLVTSADKPKFFRALVKIAETLGVSASDIIDFFRDGEKAYREIHPRTKDSVPPASRSKTL